MKWLFVFLNVAAAVGIVWGGTVICAIHRVHSFSTYVGLEKQGAFVSKPAEKAPQPGEPSRISQEDIQESLKNIGGLDSNLPVVTHTAAAFFLLNAIAFSIVWKKQLALQSATP